MKKSPSKIVLRKETLRALVNKELTLAVGGNGDVVLLRPVSGDKCGDVQIN